MTDQPMTPAEVEDAVRQLRELGHVVTLNEHPEPHDPPGDRATSERADWDEA